MEVEDIEEEEEGEGDTEEEEEEGVGGNKVKFSCDFYRPEYFLNVIDFLGDQRG